MNGMSDTCPKPDDEISFDPTTNKNLEKPFVFQIND